MHTPNDRLSNKKRSNNSVLSTSILSTIGSTNTKSSIKVLQEFNDHADPLQAAQIQKEMGIVFFQKADFDNALLYLNQALTGYRSLDNQEKEVIQILNHIGIIYLEKDNFEFATSNFEQAQEVLNDLDDNSSMERALTSYHFGLLFNKKNEPKHAFPYFISALNIFRDIEKEEYVADILYHLGNLYLTQDDIEEAKIAFTEGLELDQKYHAGQEAHIFSRLGKIYFLQNEYKSAETYLKSACMLLHDKETSEFAEAWFYRGLINNILMKPSEAVDSLNRALMNYRQINDDEFYNLHIARTLFNLGLAQKALFQHQFASNSFSEALELFQKTYPTTPEHPEICSARSLLTEIDALLVTSSANNGANSNQAANNDLQFIDFGTSSQPRSEQSTPKPQSESLCCCGLFGSSKRKMSDHMPNSALTEKLTVTNPIAAQMIR